MKPRMPAETPSARLAAGLDSATPAVAVARATRPGEAVLAATISELPSKLAAAALPGPLLVMFGRAFTEALAERIKPAEESRIPSDPADGRNVAGRTSAWQGFRVAPQSSPAERWG